MYVTRLRRPSTLKNCLTANSFCLFIFTAADHCAIGNPCKNGGTCINGEKTFECHCLPGFYGKDCGGMHYIFQA